MSLQGLTADGELVKLGAKGAKFQVDTDESGSQDFIDSVKAEAERKREQEAAANTDSHPSEQGNAVSNFSADKNPLRPEDAKGEALIQTTHGAQTTPVIEHAIEPARSTASQGGNSKTSRNR